MENEKIRNSALYCYVCQGLTEELEKEGIISLRTEDPLSGRTVTICNECLKALNRKLYTEGKPLNFNKRVKKTKDEPSSPLIITPKYIYNLINEYVIGQEKAKKAISLAVATHLRRLEDSSIENPTFYLWARLGLEKPS